MLLGIVSMLNDIGSEMFVPVIPAIIVVLFNGPAFAVGVLLGVSQFLAKATSVVFGYLSDKGKKRKRFIILGYSWAALFRILLITASSWIMFSFYYIVSRLGKGMRESPRDALIAESEDKHTLGAAFGFRKFLDNVGAIIGPLILLFLFSIFGASSKDYILRLVILFASIPIVLSAVITLFLNDSKSKCKDTHKQPAGLIGSVSNLLDKKRRLYLTLFLIALAHFDVGIYILFMQEYLDLGFIPLVYIAYVTAYTIFSFPLGVLSSRFGGRRVLITSLLLLTCGVVIISVYKTLSASILFMFLFGIFVAGKKVSIPTLITSETTNNEYATNIGLYRSMDGIGLLISNTLAGFLWGIRFFDIPMVFFISVLLLIISSASAFSFKN